MWFFYKMKGKLQCTLGKFLREEASENTYDECSGLIGQSEL